MMYYGDDPEQAIQKILADKRHAASLMKPLRETLTKYAGKVYNKRFLDALRTAADYKRIYDERRADMVFIYCYSPDGYSYTQRTICRISLTDKRIDAAASAKSAVEYYTKHLQEAAKIEEYAPQAATIKKQLAELEHLQNKIRSTVPWEVRDIYHI